MPVFLRLIIAVGVFGLCFAELCAQQPAAPTPAVVHKVEPGLENAVRWKWKVAPSDGKAWGLPMPERPVLPAQTAALPSLFHPEKPTPDPASVYEVRKGDVLIRIAKKTGVPLAQLKMFNGLQSDTIRIGQQLRIPTPDEVKALGGGPAEVVKPAQAPSAKAPTEAQSVQDAVILQIFLDRANFSPGPISGNPGPALQKLAFLYRTARPEVGDALMEKARAEVGAPFTRYTLKPEDFRFIAPPKAERAAQAAATPAPSGKGKGKPAPNATPPPTYEELISAPLLAYRSPWEFVAERFHCDEGFLRSLNSKQKTMPVIGTELQVPNVPPFEIENAFREPLQPSADPQNPVTAAVVEMSRIEVWRGGTLIALMPMAIARPDLRGRGAWTILNAVPRPSLSTVQEPTDGGAAAAPVSNFYVGPKNEPVVQEKRPVLAAEQVLPPGPNNPAGILWINLAKANSTEPLPYGLHGTSSPDRMRSQESIGGLRLTNWDVARIVRLLPQGTPLQWK